MRYDSLFNYVVVDFHRSAFAVPAITLFLFLFVSSVYAANPPVAPTNPVGFTKVTTPYSSTTSPPQISHIPPRGVPNVGGGSSYPVPPTRPITPIVSNGGFNAPAGGGITIEGVKSPPIPTSGTANYPKSTVGNAAKSLLRNNLAGLALGAGLQALLNGIGALIDEGGNVVKKAPPTNLPIVSCSQSSSYCRTSRGAQGGCANAQCSNVNTGDPLYPVFIHTPKGEHSCTSTHGCGATFALTVSDMPLVGLTANNWSGLGVYTNGLPPLDDQYVPVPPEQIDDAVDNSYNPDPSDFDNLTPYMFPQSYTQNPIPTVYLPTVTTTQTNAAGDTTTTNTTTSIDFTVDNSKPIPEVETKVTENKESFTNGQPSGSSSTSTTTKPNNNPQAPPATGGGTTVQFPEMPIDCDLFPTACAWMEWTKQEPEEPEDNLSDLLQEVPIVNETFTITGGAASCPAPLVLDLSQFGSREVSYQPLCDLASTMKYLYLALMSFAAAVLLNRSINRV